MSKSVNNLAPSKQAEIELHHRFTRHRQTDIMVTVFLFAIALTSGVFLILGPEMLHVPDQYFKCFTYVCWATSGIFSAGTFGLICKSYVLAAGDKRGRSKQKQSKIIYVSKNGDINQPVVVSATEHLLLRDRIKQIEKKLNL